ncbi:uncharacterized protein MELLADRAFT_116036 [Melampsora larici-populina 98AG31]|uniref:Rho-GAP domain-containing protein n=1 Tax=Melampsora larici-populina (strain 98AG31 / pathotype 3-4-7) TaxID=747676 RepID=F4RH49_MELLP|nr:uncharacterized protein MELLADRAFT_116036 [Melampsora larici-populina 98AG31]EGG08395.1 hypothetical protein MELLADRAFT_116036 [Melampsora larici-populina 98AG31]
MMMMSNDSVEGKINENLKKEAALSSSERKFKIEIQTSNSNQSTLLLNKKYQLSNNQSPSSTSKYSKPTSTSTSDTNSSSGSSITSPIQIRKLQSHSTLTQSPTSSPSSSLTLPLPSPSSPHSPGFFSKSTSRAKRLSSLVLSSTTSTSNRSQSISISNPTIINTTNTNLMHLSDLNQLHQPPPPPPIPVPPINTSSPLDPSRPSISNATIIPSSSQSFSSASSLPPNHSSNPNQPGLVPIDFDEGVLRTLCNLECGLPLILDRLKQAIGSAREVSSFLKKKSQLEEEYGQKLSRLSRSTLEIYNHSGGEVKSGSFSNQFRNFLFVHEKIGLERIEHSIKVANVSDELLNVSKEVERVRKSNKDIGFRLEKSVTEAEAAAEKAKLKFELTAEELEKMLIAKNGGGNEMMGSHHPSGHSGSGSGGGGSGGGQLMTKAISKLTTKSVKSAGQLAKMEEEARAKMSNVSDLYRAQILATQQVRQEYFNLQLPRILRTLKEHSDEIDLGIQYYLTNYVTQTESIVLNEALSISSLPTASDQEPAHQSLSFQIKSIDNRSDFKDYMANYAAHFNQTHLSSIPNLPNLSHHPNPNLNHLQPISSTVPMIGSPKSSMEIDQQHQKSFGVDLALQLSKQTQQNGSNGNSVPRILERCVKAIERAGGLELVGVYRLSGTTSKIAKLKSKLDSDVEGVDLNLKLENVSELNDLTGVLKLWLRELPEPLLTWNLYPGFIEAGRIENDRLRHIRLHERVNELPDPNYATLKYLMGHLDKVRRNESINSMSSSNLAVIFGPTLLSPPKSRSSIPNHSNQFPQDSLPNDLIGVNGNGNPNNSNALLEMSAQCRAIETILVHYREIFVEEEDEDQEEEEEVEEEEVVEDGSGVGKMKMNGGSLDQSHDLTNYQLKEKRSDLPNHHHHHHQQQHSHQISL